MGSRWVPLLLAPGAMALVRVWVLVLAFNTDLAQKTLEEVPVQLDFDAHKVEGCWFTIQLASSLRDLVLTTDPLRLSLHSIWTRSSGDVDFVLYEKGEGLCTGFNVTVHPTGLQGQYQGSSRRILEDPMWLGKYLGFVEKFQLQKSLIFNIADQCPLDEATA